MTGYTTKAADLVRSLPISDVWRLLGGGPIKHRRGRAWWRGGDGQSVSINDTTGTWYDHRDAVGGGVIDLITRVNSGTRAEALKWLASAMGVSLGDRHLDPEAKAEWGALLRDRPSARLWRLAALDLVDTIMTNLKAALFDPTLPPPEDGEILALERFYASIRTASDTELVKEYRAWLEQWPCTTGAMVWIAQNSERANRLALERYFAQTDPPKRAAA